MSLSIKEYKVNGDRVSLVRSKDLVVVRTLNGTHPHSILENVLKRNGITKKDVDEYPEASVWVFKLFLKQSLTVDDFKEDVRSESNPNLDYVGSVWMDADSKRYQIYTGNLFIQFHPYCSARTCAQILKESGLSNKLKLGFSKNAYFVVPVDELDMDAFEWSVNLLKDKRVKACQPELVVKRKSFAKSKRKYQVDPDRNWISEKIMLNDAWEKTKGKGVKICIIDDGIDADHPAFKKEGKIFSSRDMLKDKANPLAKHLDHTELHGTACASVASSSDYRAYGIAPDSELIIIRSKGLGSVLEAEAICWAVEQGADVISCSWGPSDGDIDDPSDNELPSHRMPEHTRLAIEYAVEKGRNGRGCPIFFAAGNGKEPVEMDTYASNRNVMAIGSVNKENELSHYSDFGRPMFCVFPSSEIQKIDGKYHTLYGHTVADRLSVAGYSDSDYYSQFGGTSASAPGMAGIAALALSLKPSLTLSELKSLIIKSCDKIGIQEHYDSDGYSEKYGYGLINAKTLVSNVLNENDSQKTNITMSTNRKGYALHIGVDVTDPKAYNNFSPLHGCVNDANALREITKMKEKFHSVKSLENGTANRENIKREITELAKNAKSGDLVLISYAGHGSYIIDTSGDEPEDQVLVTYDGFLIDDEINDLFLAFDEGVRVVWIADCCHAESNTRNYEEGVRYRFLYQRSVQAHYEKNRGKYEEARNKLTRKGRETTKASVWCVYACKKTQYAQELRGRGRFTQKIEDIYNKNFYSDLDAVSTILDKPLAPTQEPKYEFYGENKELFNDGGMFKVNNNVSLKSVNSESPSPSEQKSQTSRDDLRSSSILIESKSNSVVLKNSLRSGGQGSNELRIVDSELQVDNDSTENPWDSAYQIFHELEDDSDVEFIEPNIVHGDALDHPSIKRGDADPDKYDFLTKYPNAYHDKFIGELTNPYIWHLDDNYSQLRSAFNDIRKKFKDGKPTGNQINELPIICHIDTGILPDHPAIPEFYVPEMSRSFKAIGKSKDVTDYDSKLPIPEQQAHGTGTISILAGNRVGREHTGGDFAGYYGAFPFARVVTLKISESVVLLSGIKFARALRYAVDHVKCDVVTMSMAGAPSRIMVRAINYAYEKGVVVVSAAGNSWVEGGKKLLPKKTMYPARFGRVIGVTGATLNHTPYLVNENEDWENYDISSRSSGGHVMQTCYGPKSASKTNLAGYTPNVMWAEAFKNGSYFVKSGGGTSSATPQVAAAAAMWIYTHRKELQNITKRGDLWRKAELTRQALFKGAEKSKNKEFNEVFGNGMLKAKNSLAITPQSLKGKYSKTKKDSIGLFGIDELINQFRNRSSSNSDKEKLSEMIATEVSQLCTLDSKFYHFDEDTDIADMAEAIIESEYASDYLKDFVRKCIEIKLPQSERSTGSVIGDVFASCFIKSDQGLHYHIEAENCGVQLLEQKDYDKDEVLASYELNFVPTGKRSEGAPKLKFHVPEGAEHVPALIVERDELTQSETYRWVFPEDTNDKGTRSAVGGSVPTFDLEAPDQLTRGGGKVKKFFVKIFRTIANKSLSDRPGLIAGHYVNGSFEWVDMESVKQKIKDQSKTLLLLHGTFSSAEVSFMSLYENAEFFKGLKSNGYGEYVLAYNMSTIRSKVSSNSSDLDSALKSNGIGKSKISVIGYSRGCLVARKSFSSNTKMALVAGTHLGTPMASREHLTSLVNRVSNLAGVAFGVGSTLTIFLRGLSGVVGFIFKAKGIADQEPNSALVNELKSKPLNDKQLVIGSDFEPDHAVLKKLGDQAVDIAIFGNKPNDGVTPLDSALVNSDGVNHTPYYQDPLGELNHFSYFGNEGVVKKILEHFNG